MTDSPNQSSGHRPPDTEDPLLLSIAAKQAALVQQIITLTCYIPSSSVGAVIGRKGSTIAQIQRQAQQVGTSNGPVRLSIVGHQSEIAAMHNGESPEMEPLHHLQSSPIQLQSPQQQQVSTPIPSTTSSVPYTYSELDWSSPHWTPVVIRADPCAAITAAQLLRGKVGQLDDVVMDVPLGRAKHAAIVGRRGYVLANLSADTNVRIMVPRRELRHDVIQLEGELDNVKQCLQKVLVISSEPTGGSKKKANGAPGGSPNTAKTDEPLSVVVTMTALPSQTKLRTVGRKTDTMIKKKKVDDSSWDLTVTGSTPDNVQSAVSILKKWNEDNANGNNGNAIGNSSSGRPTRHRRTHAQIRSAKRRREQQQNNHNRGAKNAESPAN